MDVGLEWVRMMGRARERKERRGREIEEKV